MKAVWLSCAAVSVLACEVAPRPVEVTRPAPLFRASCWTAPLGVCTEYTDEAFALGESLLKTGCHEVSGTWSPARCPVDRRLGSCSVHGGTRVYYPAGELAFTVASAARDCVELYQGSFSAIR